MVIHYAGWDIGDVAGGAGRDKQAPRRHRRHSDYPQAAALALLEACREAAKGKSPPDPGQALPINPIEDGKVMRR